MGIEPNDNGLPRTLACYGCGEMHPSAGAEINCLRAAVTRLHGIVQGYRKLMFGRERMPREARRGP